MAHDVKDPEKSKVAEACYHVIREEYLYVSVRSEKLANKVYIALTFCAFIFMYVMGLMGNIASFTFPVNRLQSILVIGYILLCVCTFLLFLYTLIKLASLLTPTELTWINPLGFMPEKFQSTDAFDFYEIICKQYQECKDNNDTVLKERFAKYKKCITGLKIVVMCLFVLSVAQLAILLIQKSVGQDALDLELLSLIKQIRATIPSQ